MVQSEADDYEPQCFIPQILNGVITLVNVVRARRCCLIAHNDSFLAHKTNKPQPEPLAKSTPAIEQHVFRTPLSRNSLAMSSISEHISKVKSINHSSYTPDFPRRAPNINSGLVNLPCTPSSRSNIVPSTSPSTGSKALNSPQLSMTNHNSSLSVLPALPSISSSPVDISIGNVLSMESFSNATPNVTFLEKKVMQRGIQWRNCKTPIRTYSKNTPSQTNRDEYMFNFSPKYCNGVSIPRYVLNGTKGIPAEGNISVRRRTKVLFDEKTRISPETYKRNIADTSDLKRKTDEEFIYSRSRKLFKGAYEKATVFTLPWKKNCAEALKGHFEDVLSNTIVPTKEGYSKLLQEIPPFGVTEEPIVETKINEEVEVNMETNEVIIKRKNAMFARRLF